MGCVICSPVVSVLDCHARGRVFKPAKAEICFKIFAHLRPLVDSTIMSSLTEYSSSHG